MTGLASSKSEDLDIAIIELCSISLQLKTREDVGGGVILLGLYVTPITANSEHLKYSLSVNRIKAI